MRTRMTHAERRATTRQSILDVARETFLERGYHGATLEQISEAAGFTKGAVYAHFESKADLLLALIEQRIEGRLQDLAAISALGLPPADLARALYRQAAGDTRANTRWGLLVTEFRVHAMRDRTLTSRYLRLHDRLRDGLAEVMAEGFRRAGLKPAVEPRLLSMAGLALAVGAMLERGAAGDEFPDFLLEELQGPMVELALRDRARPVGRDGRPPSTPRRAAGGSR